MPGLASVKNRLFRTPPARLASAVALRAGRAWRLAGTTFGYVASGRPYLPALRARRSSISPTRSRDVVMLVVSDLRIDPRVEREARALAAAGYAVKVLFPDISLPRIAEKPLDWGPGVSFRPLPGENSAYIMSPPWLLGDGLHKAACEERPFAFHCHDLNTAIIGLSAARRTGARCICDFHEWYSENVSWDSRERRWVPHPPLQRRLFRLAERLVMARADVVVTVCDSIAHDLVKELSHGAREVHVVRNIPDLAAGDRPYPPLKRQLGIEESAFVLLWQGGTGPTRFIEPIIEALQYAPGVVFVIRGPSLELFGDGYRALAGKCGVADRLVLVPPVPSADVVAAARGADAGIWTLPKLSKNFYYALPNKIFEYMASGLPVLAANFPEARKMVEGNGVGLCFDPYDPRSIAAQINRLRTEPGLADRLRAAIPEALRRIDADREWQKLVEIYRRLEKAEA
jgi:glycosyltransferase involved in cell wall biosynthesis